MIQRFDRSFFVAPLCALVITGQLALPLNHAMASADFDYNYIISDHDLTDYLSLNLEQIQAFLVSKGSPLASYLDPVTRMRAAQIIYQSAQDFQISPKFLLALIQKEQSLVEDGTPLPRQYDWATGYAVCDGCSTDDPALQKFKGFYNQVYNAAKRIRTVYLAELDSQGRTASGFGPGMPKQVDGISVTPATRATAAVYTYTPHLHGNLLLYQIWQRFFARAYPDGTLLNVDGEREVWLIENGYRRQFANRSVYLSYYADFDRVLTVNRQELEKYPEGRPLAFANYSYLRTPRGTVYLLVDDRLRGFDSQEALRQVGVNPEEIQDVAQEDLMGYEEDRPISSASVYPLGALLQDKQSGGVYWVQDGSKHPIWSREIMRINYGGRSISPRSTAELATYATGEPVRLRDGELVRSADDPAVYLISHGLRRPFLSEAAFLQLGFDWAQVITTTAQALELHALGEPIASSF